MPVRNLTIIVVSAIVSMVCYTTTPHNRDAAVIADAIEKIETRYVDEVDRRDLFENALQGMIGSLGDPNSRYFPPLRNKQLEEELEQKFGGVGIIVRPVIDKDREGNENGEINRVFVLSPQPDSPAKKAGMKPGDEILEIDGQPLKGMKYQESVELMRGEVGKPVVVTIRRHGEKEPLELNITRDKIVVDSVMGDRQHADWTWDFFLEDHPRIGYIRMTQFGERTVEEMEEALKFNGRKVKGLILDLRSNPGGLLTAAVDVSDLFIDEGVIVTTRGRGGVERKRETAKSSTTAIPTDLPMVVLIDGLSASASEIVSACLQDHRRAVVIGERSWGKGTVQNVIDLDSGRGALKLTTERYWRPSGKNIDRMKDAKEEDEWGVKPNEGMKVELSKEETVEVHLQRSMRDYESFLQLMAPEVQELLRRKPSEKDNSDKENKLPADFKDPPLRKAIEHLQEQIQPKPAETKRA